MKTIKLNNNVEIPVLGLGTFASEKQELELAVSTAFECGCRMIDTAQMYKNEADVGAALKKTGAARDSYFISTKIYETARSYDLAAEAIDRSLRDLQTDYIDLLLLHMPYEESLEMYRAMEDALKAGKARAIGVCNFTEKRYLDFIGKVDVLPVVDQFETHIFQQNHGLQKTLEENGTKLMAWSPLAKGRNNVFNNEKLLEIAGKYGKTTAQVMLANLVQRGIIVIPKSVNPKRIRENCDIFDFELDKSDMDALTALDENKTLLEWTKNL